MIQLLSVQGSVSTHGFLNVSYPSTVCIVTRFPGPSMYANYLTDIIWQPAVKILSMQ